jgi:hypothetical protein
MLALRGPPQERNRKNEESPVSRHDVPAKHQAFEVTVGWDQPLSTYFAIVLRCDDDDDDPLDDPVVLWLGGIPCEYPRAEDMIAPLMPYAELSEEMIAMLREDQVALLDRGPKPHQRRKVNWLYRRSI